MAEPPEEGSEPSNLPVRASDLANYLVCPRKAWLVRRGITLEQDSDVVALGKLIDETAYAREKRPATVWAHAPDGTLLSAKFDGLNLRDGIVREVKKSPSCEEAHVWQVRFYLWMLWLQGVRKRDGSAWSGLIQYPALRRQEAVALAPEHQAELERLVRAVRALDTSPIPPRLSKRSFCTRCAFEELCYA